MANSLALKNLRDCRWDQDTAGNTAMRGNAKAVHPTLDYRRKEDSNVSITRELDR